MIMLITIVLVIATYQDMNITEADFYERGMRRIMVVTDGAFTDSSDIAKKVKFEKIYFVGTTMNVEHLEMFADEIEKIQI